MRHHKEQGWICEYEPKIYVETLQQMSRTRHWNILNKEIEQQIYVGQKKKKILMSLKEVKND